MTTPFSFSILPDEVLCLILKNVGPKEVEAISLTDSKMFQRFRKPSPPSDQIIGIIMLNKYFVDVNLLNPFRHSHLNLLFLWQCRVIMMRKVPWNFVIPECIHLFHPPLSKEKTGTHYRSKSSAFLVKYGKGVGMYHLSIYDEKKYGLRMSLPKDLTFLNSVQKFPFYNEKTTSIMPPSMTTHLVYSIDPEKQEHQDFVRFYRSFEKRLLELSHQLIEQRFQQNINIKNYHVPLCLSSLLTPFGEEGMLESFLTSPIPFDKTPVFIKTNTGYDGIAPLCLTINTKETETEPFQVSQVPQVPILPTLFIGRIIVNEQFSLKRKRGKHQEIPDLVLIQPQIFNNQKR